jgi:hypothetical protein
MYLLVKENDETIFCKDKQDKYIRTLDKAKERALELACLFDSNVSVYEKLGEITPRVLEKKA